MGWLTAWGEQKTRAFVEGLIKHGAIVRRGHTLQAQLLCAGEFKVAVEIYPDGILRMKQGRLPGSDRFSQPDAGAYQRRHRHLHQYAASPRCCVVHRFHEIGGGRQNSCVDRPSLWTQGCQIGL